MTTEKQVGEQVTQSEVEDEVLEVALNPEDAKALEGIVEPTKELEVVPPERTYTQKEYQGLQRTLSERERDIQRLKSQGVDVSTLKEELALQRERLELVLDHLEAGGTSLPELEREPAPELTPLQKRRRELATKEKVKASQPDEGGQFFSAVRQAGLNPYNQEFQQFFGALSGPTEALEKLPEFIQGRTSKQQAERAEELKKATKPLQDEIEALKEKLGLKTVETGGPSSPGGAGTLAELNALFRRGELSLDEFQERSEAFKRGV